jgi:putative oxidoreductase
MTDTQSYGALLGRVLLAFMFILSGWGKLNDIPSAMAYTASGGLLGIAVLPAIAIEILGGLAVLVGWQTRWAALALAVFCVLSGLLYHYVPGKGLEGVERGREMVNFEKNLAIAGGFLVLSVMGPGSISLDARRGRTAAA